jgi:hypothetical protein
MEIAPAQLNRNKATPGRNVKPLELIGLVSLEIEEDG